ncbi:MAG: DNA translocase FtsK 4TM domain-containing protein [Candidatus Paceibacterota bacterium]|jgi:S-DNA-T family DNA segregation ATPase FtsK/SpoIIIE
MAKNKTETITKKQIITKDNKPGKKPTGLGIKQETKHGVLAVVCFALALFFILAAFNKAGIAGEFFYKIFSYLFGVGYSLLPILLVILGISFTRPTRPDVALSHTISSFLFLGSTLGIISISIGADGAGGALGSIVSYPFLKLFDIYASILFLGALLIISLFVLFDERPNLTPFFSFIRSLFKKKEKIEEEEPIPEPEEEPEITSDEPETEEKKSVKEKVVKMLGLESNADEFIPNTSKSKNRSSYVPPPLSLLERDKGKPNVGDIKANANIIKRTLSNFGIEVEMDEITIGPTVTRYALKPAQGVKLSRIVGLQNDLSLALAAHPIRIEAPIPGQSLVGIEIPNKVKSMVGLASLFSDEKFQNAVKPLMIGLGRGLSGKSVFANLAKMPHCLIAGTTGSGKSVTIHAIITSLLYRNGPEDLKLIMVDPKRVELTLYNKIPHLLTPVITDAKKAILALKWAANEMSRRYDILESESVRDVESYHNNVVKPYFSKKHSETDEEDASKPDTMPYIVIIIDELADIMSAYPRELESAIVRLAQMSRAVGIHLILSTQRPEVNVITGLIKANVPARIALKVASQIDSRTILDSGGAEKLLGGGDMLYSSGEAQPERVQCGYISEDEVKKVVKYLADSYKDEIINEISLSGTVSTDKSIFESTLDDENEDDDMYEEARVTVIQAGKASTSFLQRKLGLGYARAARIIDMLEERGIVGPGSGAKPRDVLEKPVDHTSEI